MIQCVVALKQLVAARWHRGAAVAHIATPIHDPTTDPACVVGGAEGVKLQKT